MAPKEKFFKMEQGEISPPTHKNPGNWKPVCKKIQIFITYSR
jgi:hypothetical protein